MAPIGCTVTQQRHRDRAIGARDRAHACEVVRVRRPHHRMWTISPIQDRPAERCDPRVGAVGKLRRVAPRTVASSRCRVRAQMEQCRHRIRAAVAPSARRTDSRARSTIRSNTGCGSPGEADIAFSTSMVAA